LDLAMPRDVEPAAASLPGVVLIGMDQLSGHATAVRDDDVAAVRAILEAELAGYQSAVDAARVAPTVVALRAKAGPDSCGCGPPSSAPAEAACCARTAARQPPPPASSAVISQRNCCDPAPQISSPCRRHQPGSSNNASER
jgi:hypothetical protein